MKSQAAAGAPSSPARGKRALSLRPRKPGPAACLNEKRARVPAPPSASLQQNKRQRYERGKLPGATCANSAEVLKTVVHDCCKGPASSAPAGRIHRLAGRKLQHGDGSIRHQLEVEPLQGAQRDFIRREEHVAAGLNVDDAALAEIPEERSPKTI